MVKRTLLLATCLLACMAHAMAPSVADDRIAIAEIKSLWSQQLQDAKAISKEAGQKILTLRSSGKLISQDIVLQNGKKVRQTNADVEASQYIIDALTKRYPTYGLLSQDQMDKDPNWHTKEYVWMINPIDGTKEYEKGSDDFHVQVGLLEGNTPVLGVSYYPVTDTYAWAVKGQGAWLEKEGAIQQRLHAVPSSEKILLKSTSHQVITSYFAKWNWVPAKVNEEHVSSTSRLLKILRGEASLYISLGASPLGTEKKGGVWNYGANVVIAKESGLMLTTLNGHQINLREPHGLLIEGVVVTNDPEAYDAVVQSDWRLQ